MRVRSSHNRVAADMTASAVRLNVHRSDASHSRRPSGNEQVSPSYARDHSQNDVKIEEYESDYASGRGSRSNSIRFVILKDDVMFENPKTPELKAVLKRQVN